MNSKVKKSGNEVKEPETTKVSKSELHGRIIYSMLLPSVRIARACQAPLKEITEWAQLAYLKDLLKNGESLKDASSLLQISLRKVSMLSAKLRSNFFEPEREHGIRSQVEFALWVEPLSRKRLGQYLHKIDEAELDEAIATLEDQGRIALDPGRTPTYRVTGKESRLVRDDLLSRIDGLNSLLSVVSDAVFARFFQNDEKAFARSLQFRIREQDLPELQALYEDHIWKTLAALDAAAEEDPNAIETGFAVCWAPDNYINASIDDADDK